MSDLTLANYLLSAEAIRERCHQVYKSVVAGDGLVFAIDDGQVAATVQRVRDVILSDYPDLEIPYHSRWRHLTFGDDQRLTKLLPQPTDAAAAGAQAYDLVIPSILIDAGAGPDWRFTENGQSYNRSEGLGVASVHLFKQGLFGAGSQQTTAAGLAQLSAAAFLEGMQVSASNPIVGGEGRLGLLKGLGKALAANPEVFGTEARLGNLFHYFVGKAKGNQLAAATILQDVLNLFGAIWPGRSQLAGKNLGDTWTHPAIIGRDSSDKYVPFHKLSQWLTYSLLEPLETFGIAVTGLDDLTGLPEYRNGGLFIDSGLLVPKDPQTLATNHEPGSPTIVEWRAATVCLIDQLAPKIIASLPTNNKTWSLAKILQGGTWSAGRQIARERRPSGTPPLNIKSDGTVF